MSERYILLNSFGLAESDAKEFESVESALDWMEETARELRRKVWLHSVDLIAESEFIDYHEYIKSDEWREKADAAKERAGYRCQVCNSPNNLNAHHRTYENLGDEKPEDITVLCKGCHALFHDQRQLTAPVRKSKAKPAPSTRDDLVTERSTHVTEETYLPEESRIVKEEWDNIRNAVLREETNLAALLGVASPLAVTTTEWLVLEFEYPILATKAREHFERESPQVLTREIRRLIGLELRVETVAKYNGGGQ